MSLLGAVLAGGQSSRMGVDKATVEIEGETLLARVTGALQGVGRHVVVLGPDRPGYECWPDSAGTAGPLAGLVTALARMTHDRVLVVAVDHAFVSPVTLRQLAAVESELPVVPVDDSGVRQVTCSVYPRAVVEAATEEAAAGGSIQSLLDRVSFIPITPERWRAWGEDGRSWFSVDTADDLETGARLFSV